MDIGPWPSPRVHTPPTRDMAGLITWIICHNLQELYNHAMSCELLELFFPVSKFRDTCIIAHV
jgi:hypothetical protein